jgi:hypothetical protein
MTPMIANMRIKNAHSCSLGRRYRGAPYASLVRQKILGSSMKLDNVTYEQLLFVMKACAGLDAQLIDDENLRSYRFYHNWKDGVSLATYENGSGDDLAILFKNGCALIKGFDHESEVSPYAQEEYEIWPGIYEGAPEELLAELDDESLEKDHVTFCYWLVSNDTNWRQGPVSFSGGEDDGANWLLSAIKFNSYQFFEWANDYFEGNIERLTYEDVEAEFNKESESYKAISPLFYCTYQNAESIESNNPIRVNKEEFHRITSNIVGHEKNFVGFIDDEKTVLQFYVESNDKIWVEIPAVKEQGSYGAYISDKQMYEVFEDFKQPYVNYKDELNLMFQAW